MAEHISRNTVFTFYSASRTYGLPPLEKACIRWLRLALMPFETDNQFLLSIKYDHSYSVGYLNQLVIFLLLQQHINVGTFVFKRVTSFARRGGIVSAY